MLRQGLFCITQCRCARLRATFRLRLALGLCDEPYSVSDVPALKEQRNEGLLPKQQSLFVKEIIYISFHSEESKEDLKILKKLQNSSSFPIDISFVYQHFTNCWSPEARLELYRCWEAETRPPEGSKGAAPDLLTWGGSHQSAALGLLWLSTLHKRKRVCSHFWCYFYPFAH